MLWWESRAKTHPEWSRHSRWWAGGPYPVSVPRQLQGKASPQIQPEHPWFWNSDWEGVSNTIHELSSFSASQSQLWPQCYCEEQLNITSPHPHLTVFEIQELLPLIWNNGQAGKIPRACKTFGWRRQLPQSCFAGLNLDSCAGEQLRFCPADSLSEIDCCHLLQNGKRLKKNRFSFFKVWNATVLTWKDTQSALQLGECDAN